MKLQLSYLRRYWFLVALVLVLFIITVSYIKLVLDVSGQRPVYDALPESSSVIFEFKNVGDAIQKISDTQFGDQVLEAGFLKKLSSQVAGIDSIISKLKNDTIGVRWEKNTLLAAINLTEINEYDYLYLLKAKGFSKEDFTQLFTSSRAEELDVIKRVFKDEAIYELHSDKWGNLTCSYLNGIFIASFTSFLVEESIVQLREKTSILKNKDFKEIRELGGEDADALVYLNFASLGLFQPLLVNNEQSSLFKALTNFGNWMELDIKVRNNAFIFNGYTNITKDKSNFLSRFTKEPSNQIQMTDALPASTSLFIYHAVDDFKTYLENNPEISEKASSELGYLKNWMGNEWCFGLLEPLDANYLEEAYLVVKAIDPEIAYNSLKEISRLNERETNNEFGDFKIGRLPLMKGELNDLLGHDFIYLENPYFTIIDNYVVFANAQSALKTIITQYTERQTLDKSPDYITFSENLSTTPNYYVYVNTSKAVEILNTLLSAQFVSAIKKGNKEFVKFTPVGFQLGFYDHVFFTNGYVRFQQQVEESTNLLWQAKLEANAATRPSLVTNHYTNDMEIFVQDSLQNIYLITKAGKILWKRQLDGFIQSDIFQMDFYENTKFQFLFNTHDRIYLVDRNGKDVASFPLKLPAEASNGLTLVEYDNKRNYRIFIACKNNNLYGFYRSGKPLPGWSPIAKVGLVKYPIRHILVEGKDYLVATNEEGVMNFFDRRGDKRVPSMNLGHTFDTDFQVREFKNTFQLFNADREGNFYKVYRNGTFVTQKQNLPASFIDFQYADMDRNDEFEIFFIDTFIVKTYDEMYKEKNTSSFPQNIDSRGFIVDYGPGKRKGLGLLSKQTGKIYVMDHEFKFAPSFPLNGCTEFIAGDIFETGRRVIIVGSCDGYVNAYQVR